jgi:hypothetical protein
MDVITLRIALADVGRPNCAFPKTEFQEENETWLRALLAVMLISMLA